MTKANWSILRPQPECGACPASNARDAGRSERVRKSTLYETRIALKFAVPFVNADVIQRVELKDGDVNAAYEAAQIATGRRASLMADRKSFATETVFSHPSKLDLITQAKANGYRVMTFPISVAHPDLSVGRVGERVIEGGHPVPENKIRNRYDRSGPLIR